MHRLSIENKGWTAAVWNEAELVYEYDSNQRDFAQRVLFMQRRIMLHAGIPHLVLLKVPEKTALVQQR
jgi:hypothetical protein